MSVKQIHPKRGLKKTICIPGDKSISHRSIILGAIASGTTEITHFLESADCLATIDCFRKMGVEIERTPARVLVRGKGLYGLSKPEQILNVGNSGTTARLLTGLLSGQHFSSILSGDESLTTRPMDRILTPLNLMGANACGLEKSGFAPLKIAPGELRGISYVSPVSSAQIKSSILLAGLYANGKSTVTEPFLSRNHTELMLTGFGANVLSCAGDHTKKPSVTLVPGNKLTGQKITVPGDISSAAYFIAAGLLVPNSEICVTNVGINSTRAGFLDVCNSMCADITLLNQTTSGGEATADILAKTSVLRGTTISGRLIPTLIDELPMIAVMAACAEGQTIIKDAAELKVKETDRIRTVTENLRAMGGNITPTEDGMIIEGSAQLHGTHIQSHLDHRIAMSFAIAGLIASGSTVINNSQCVDVSYPTFWESGIF